jgi:hypothetical protein
MRAASQAFRVGRAEGGEQLADRRLHDRSLLEREAGGMRVRADDRDAHGIPRGAAPPVIARIAIASGRVARVVERKALVS